MENIHCRVENGVLKLFAGTVENELDITPFLTGPSPSTGQKQRYPGRFMAYLNAHYPLEHQRILEMFAGSGEVKAFRLRLDEKQDFEEYNRVMTTDIRHETGADIIAPYDELNYKGSPFDIVLADPPYNAGYSSEGTDHASHLPKPMRIQREAAKILNMGGLCMIMHVIQVPAYKENGMKSVAYHPLMVGPNNAARLLCVARKVMEFDEAQDKFKGSEPELMPVEHNLMQVAISFGERAVERKP